MYHIIISKFCQSTQVYCQLQWGGGGSGRVGVKGHMQRKISKPQNFEKMKISIYKIDMQNDKSHCVL